jgi:hypothetical protein
LNAPKKRASPPFASFRGRSSSAESAGDSDSALKAEMMTEIAIVTANCLLRRPWIPLIRPMGMKTEDSTRAMPTTGPDTSDIAFSVASRGGRPCSMWCSTASTTTIASSTTRPIASTKPNSESVLMENPSSGKKANVPISETGTAISGMSVARQFWRKRNTTRMTRIIASQSVDPISFMPSVTGRLVSRPIW